jgi:Photosynthetic reaction centre cytochrome C subunit
MIFSRKSLVVIMISLFVVLGIAATDAPKNPRYSNLKILPKDISDDDLGKVMGGFKDALGVKCSFCHAPSKDTASHHPDFASDDKPEKNIARKMMKMTGKINKKFFSYNKNEQGMSVPTVECMTCHRGSPHPGGMKK